MTEPAKQVTIKICAAAAPYIGADKPREMRLKAAAGKLEIPAADLVLLVFYLCNDPDPEVKRTALDTLKGLDTPFLSRLLVEPQLHPRILDALVRLHFQKAELVPLLSSHPMLSEQAAAFLAQRGALAAPKAEGTGGTPQPSTGTPSATPLAASDASRIGETEGESDGDAAEESCEATDAESDEESDEEEFQSKYQQAQSMGIADKIKMALTGDKEWRGLLIKDSNKLVSGAVVKNPRLTENEVLTIVKGSVQNDEIIRVICANKEWVKNAQIRKALAENCKTPLPMALRFVSSLSEKELAVLAKSKNISSVISTHARKILLSKKSSR